MAVLPAGGEVPARGGAVDGVDGVVGLCDGEERLESGHVVKSHHSSSE